MDGSHAAEPRSVDLLKEFLSSCATHEGRSSAEPVALSDVWRALIAGQIRIEDTFHSEQRCYLALVESHGVPVSTARNLRILEEWLVRGSQKSVALDFGLSSSTVVATARHCLVEMGVRCAPRRVPSILVMAAQASSGSGVEGDARASVLHESGRAVRIVSALRLDNQLWEALTPAELYVIRGVVEGQGHAEIARARGSSPRTVANQLAAAFQRLKVSGRAELMGRLIERRAQELDMFAAGRGAAQPTPYDRAARRSARSQSPRLVSRPR